MNPCSPPLRMDARSGGAPEVGSPLRTIGGVEACRPSSAPGRTLVGASSPVMFSVRSGPRPLFGRSGCTSSIGALPERGGATDGLVHRAQLHLVLYSAGRVAPGVDLPYRFRGRPRRGGSYRRNGGASHRRAGGRPPMPVPRTRVTAAASASRRAGAGTASVRVRCGFPGWPVSPACSGTRLAVLRLLPFLPATLHARPAGNP
jgi:hypothetical protein